jgi:RNA polymerase sigma-70 factor (ECF subfamily)
MAGLRTHASRRHRRTADERVVTFLAVTSSNRQDWRLPADPSPAELARAAAGDRDAFGLIVERYETLVYSVAYNVLGNRLDAEDAAQDAFLRCYRSLPQYRSEASFSTWLFRLALSTAVDSRRRERRRPEPVEMPEIADERVPGFGAGVDAATIVGALGDLPDDYRTPTVLRDLYGLPYQEIAELTGRPLGTVKVMVHRGRASLRLRLRAAREA